MRKLAILLAVAVLTSATVFSGSNASALSAIDVASAAGIARITNDNYGNSLVFDYDNDGTHDMLLSNHQMAPWELFRGNGNGTYAKILELPQADRHTCASADFNGDGRQDLYCSIGADHGTEANKSNELWLQAADGTLAMVPGAWGANDPSGRGRDVVAFNANNDPWPDLFVGNAFPEDFPSQNRLYLNVAGAAFVESVASGINKHSGGICAAPADFNNDGWADLFACSALNRVYQSNAGVTYTDKAKAFNLTADKAKGAAWGDMDSDGDLDLVTINDTSLRVSLWTGSTFVAGHQRTITMGRNVAMADIDLDGDLDIYAVQGRSANQTSNVPDLLLLNNGNGTAYTNFTGLPQAASGGGSNVSVIPDFNGRPAFIVTNGGDGGANFKGPRQLITFAPY